MKHIIVEGIDGSGKDTLIEKILAQYRNYTLHRRSSRSLGGPVPNLAEWVARDAVKMSEAAPSVYNRHPLISEYIYAPYRTVNPGLVDPFTNPGWRHAYTNIVAHESVVILCQPPFQTVHNVLVRQGAEAHMPGVYENAPAIYDHYASLVWFGTTIRYDYTTTAVMDLFITLDRVLRTK